MNEQQKPRDAFKSRFGFVLAAAGSAVGLGNIWKFPYITGENGGGMFVLIYLVCIALVGLPIMVAEMMIGRAAQKQPVAAIHALQGRKSPWAAVGWLGVIAGFLILSFYAVVAGWSMDYTLKSVVHFTAPITKDAEQAMTEYRATASLEKMRERLAARDAKFAAFEEVGKVRRRVAKATWDDYERFRKALMAAQEKGVDEATARERILEEEQLRDAVTRTEPVLLEIKEIEQRHAAEARAKWREAPDERVREEAGLLERQSVVKERVESAFGGLAGDGLTSTFWALIFMAVTILIVMGGISGGIERACRILMPTLMVLIVAMVLFGATTSGFGKAVQFVFAPDASKLTKDGVLEALGHAFFTLSLGMGAMITYGSYQRGKTSLLKQSVWIAGLDTGIALLACLMMFPIIFSFGMEPGAGPGLVFQSMPLAFAQLGDVGMLLAIVFFGLLVFAALTSSVSLLEVVCSYLIDEKGMGRKKAALAMGGTIFLFAIPVAYHAEGGGLFTSWEPGFGHNYLDTLDIVTSNWLLPVGGLFIAVYAGWVMPQRVRDAELEGHGSLLIMGWLLLIRFVAPALVLLVVLHKIGLW